MQKFLSSFHVYLRYQSEFSMSGITFDFVLFLGYVFSLHGNVQVVFEPLVYSSRDITNKTWRFKFAYITDVDLIFPIGFLGYVYSVGNWSFARTFPRFEVTDRIVTCDKWNVLTLDVEASMHPPPSVETKSPADICELWLSLEKSELLDMPSLSSSFIFQRARRLPGSFPRKERVRH